MAYLKVNDGHAAGGQRDGGNASDKLAHLLPALHLAVAREGPADGVDQVAGDVLLQLLKLGAGRGQKSHSQSMTPVPITHF